MVVTENFSKYDWRNPSTNDNSQTIAEFFQKYLLSQNENLIK